MTDEAKTQFNSALTTINWKDVIRSCDNNDPEEAYNNFTCIYTRLYDKYFPIKRIHCYSKNYPKKPWITRALIKSCKRNKLKSLLRQAEKGYYSDKIINCQHNLT